MQLKSCTLNPTVVIEKFTLINDEKNKAYKSKISERENYTIPSYMQIAFLFTIFCIVRS